MESTGQAKLTLHAFRNSLLFSLFLVCLFCVGCPLWNYYRSHRVVLQLPQESDRIDLPDHPETIRIAAFNIRTFGQNTLSDPYITEILARIVTQFDIVAIQELRSKNQDVIPRFLKVVNAHGARYQAIVSPRIGRNSFQEQYAYLYNKATVEAFRFPRPSFISDPEDRYHREPFLARFRTKGVPRSEAFSFTLMVIHTDPDEAIEEVRQLAESYRKVLEDISEDDVILLGDLNRAFYQMHDLRKIPHLTAILTEGEPTNIARTEQHDNILFLTNRTSEQTGKGGVYHFPHRFELTEVESRSVSDHLPVWAEFERRER